MWSCLGPVFVVGHSNNMAQVHIICSQKNCNGPTIECMLTKAVIKSINQSPVQTSVVSFKTVHTNYRKRTAEQTDIHYQYTFEAKGSVYMT